MKELNIIGFALNVGACGMCTYVAIVKPDSQFYLVPLAILNGVFAVWNFVKLIQHGVSLCRGSEVRRNPSHSAQEEV
jgi:hypothetical protein